MSCGTIIPVIIVETYEILRLLRENKEMTQQDVADFLKIGRTMYRRYETGETEMPVRHVKSLCKLYRVSADYVIGLPADFPYGIGKNNK